jgi:hypothetical protein
MLKFSFAYTIQAKGSRYYLKLPLSVFVINDSVSLFTTSSRADLGLSVTSFITALLLQGSPVIFITALLIQVSSIVFVAALLLKVSSVVIIAATLLEVSSVVIIATTLFQVSPAFVATVLCIPVPSNVFQAMPSNPGRKLVHPDTHPGTTVVR